MEDKKISKEKPKRVLTPEQLENLKKAREKANEVRRKNKEIKQFHKEQKKVEKHEAKIEIEKKRDEAMNAIIELKNKKIPAPVAEPVKEESEEEEIHVPQIPPPKTFKRAKPKPVKSTPKEPTESELYSNASIEILRNKLYEQTRQRLMNDMFNY